MHLLFLLVIGTSSFPHYDSFFQLNLEILGKKEKDQAAGLEVLEGTLME
jgi:hypothetical protein